MQRTFAIAIAVLGIGVTSFVFAEHNAVPVSTLEVSVLSHVNAVAPTPIPSLTAAAWGLFDVATGEVLVGQAENAVLPIASVTKLFVATVVVNDSRIDDPLSITWADVATPGESGKLYYGMQTTPRALLMPLLLESSNDAGEALRRFLGPGYETAIARVTEASNLTQTVIVDGSGLSADNVSSVRDLARFYSTLRMRASYVLDLTSIPMHITDTEGYVNNNPLQAHPQFVAGKHGFTDEAGRTFLGSFSGATQDREIGIVLLGSTNLEADTDDLLAYAAAAF